MKDQFTVSELASILEVYPETIRRWQRSGKLHGTKTSRKTGFIFGICDVIKFVESDPHCEYLKAIGREEDEKLGRWLRIPEFISDDLEDCEKGVPNTKLVGTGQLYFQDTTTGEMKPYEGVKNISPISRMTYKGVVYTSPTSESGREGMMSRTPLYEKREYFQAEVGDVVLYGGKCWVWLGMVEGWKEIDRTNGYFDTDMVMTREEMQYCLNDVAVTEKLFKEEKVMRFDSCKPTIKNIIFNDPATIVMWSDGTKTVVKCNKETEDFDPEKGVAMACMKKLLGTNKTGSNYLDKVQGYFDAYDEEQVDKCLAVRQRFMKFLAGCVKNGNDSTDIPPEATVEKEFEAVTSNDWTVAPADENATAEENEE